MAEIFATVDEGTPVEVADAALRPLGLPMSPYVLLQLVGPGRRPARGGKPARSLRGSLPGLGQPAGPRGFGKAGHLRLDRRRRALRQRRDRQALIVRRPAEHCGAGPGADAATALAEEIGLMLAEEVVAAPMDIDLCLILGAGWPFHLGGITPYLDREGVSERVLGRRFLPPGVAVASPANDERAALERSSDSLGDRLHRVPRDVLRGQPDLGQQLRPAAVLEELLRDAELADAVSRLRETQLLGQPGAAAADDAVVLDGDHEFMIGGEREPAPD